MATPLPPWLREHPGRGVIGRPRALPGRSRGRAIVVARPDPRPQRPHGPRGPRLTRRFSRVWPVSLFAGKWWFPKQSMTLPQPGLRLQREEQRGSGKHHFRAISMAWGGMLVALSLGMAVSHARHAAPPESEAVRGNWAAGRARSYRIIMSAGVCRRC